MPGGYLTSHRPQAIIGAAAPLPRPLRGYHPFPGPQAGSRHQRARMRASLPVQVAVRPLPLGQISLNRSDLVEAIPSGASPAAHRKGLGCTDSVESSVAGAPYFWVGE